MDLTRRYRFNGIMSICVHCIVCNDGNMYPHYYLIDRTYLQGFELNVASTTLSTRCQRTNFNSTLLEKVMVYDMFLNEDVRLLLIQAVLRNIIIITFAPLIYQ